MAKQSLRELTFSQWFYVVVPGAVGLVAGWTSRAELELPEPLYIAGGGLGVSALLLFIMVYGEDL